MSKRPALACKRRPFRVKITRMISTTWPCHRLKEEIEAKWSCLPPKKSWEKALDARSKRTRHKPTWIRLRRLLETCRVMIILRWRVQNLRVNPRKDHTKWAEIQSTPASLIIWMQDQHVLPIWTRLQVLSYQPYLSSTYSRRRETLPWTHPFKGRKSRFATSLLRSKRCKDLWLTEETKSQTTSAYITLIPNPTSLMTRIYLENFDF